MDEVKDASQNDEFKGVKGELNSIPVYKKNRMNIPLRNESRLTFYRSQVQTKGDKSPLISKDARITNLRQSLVPVLQQNFEESRENQMRIDINQNKNNNHKRKINLHSLKTKTTIQSPLLTCRSADDLGQKTLKENTCFLSNYRKLDENRSVKFIAKIRQQISSKPEKVRVTAEDEKNNALLIALTQRNKQLQRELQDSNIFEHTGVKSQDQNLSQHHLDQSLQRQTFEQKLLTKCKDLQFELELKSQQLLKLSNALNDLQLEHTSEVEALKNDHYLEKCRREFQIQNLRHQLIELQSYKSAVEKSKRQKQRIYQQQISRYVRELGECRQQKNKLILQFEDILHQRLQTAQKSYSTRFTAQLQKSSQQNTILKHQLSDLAKKLTQLQQQNQNMRQQSNLLNIQLGNYIRWKDELEQKNLAMEREVNEALRIIKCENDGLRKSIVNKQKVYERAKLTYFRNSQKLKTQIQAKLRSLSTALSETKLQNSNLKSIFTAKQKQLQCQTEKIQTIQKQLADQQVEIHRQQELIKALQTKIQHLQIEIEEWKFICESNALNNSLM